jgi:hypothetical protein
VIGLRVFITRLWVALVAACIGAAVIASAVLASLDILPILLALLVALAAVGVAIWRPVTLFYAYCAAIPFNFALPPGPAGTVARVFGLVFFVGYLIRKPDSLRLNTVPAVGWVLVAWTLTSTLWAVDTGTGYEAWLTLAQLFAITILVASLVATNPTILRKALWSYALSATLTAVVGSLSYFQGAAGDAVRAVAFPDQDPALYAGLVLPAAIFLMGEVQSRSNAALLRVIAGGALIICAAALALSGTRSAWVGIIVATVVWLIVQREPRQMLSVAALSLGVVILVISVPGIGDFLLGRAQLSLMTGEIGRAHV